MYVKDTEVVETKSTDDEKIGEVEAKDDPTENKEEDERWFE